MSVILCPCILCVTQLMDLFVMYIACLKVFVNCLLKQFAIFMGCGCNFVVECYGSVEYGWRCSVG